MRLQRLFQNCGRIFKSASFRFSAINTAITSIVVIVVAVGVLFAIEAALESQLRAQIVAESTQLLGDYADDGLDELLHDVRERIKRNAQQRLVYFVQDRNGKTVFDAFENVPTEVGWHKLDHLTDKRGAVSYSAVLFLTNQLQDGYILGVGANLEPMQQTIRLIKNIFVFSILSIFPLLWLAAYLGNRKFLNELDRINNFANEIAHTPTNLNTRLALSGSGDEIDRLMQTINNMLEKIGQLLASVKRISSNIAHDLRTPLTHLSQKLEELDAHFQTPASQAIIEDLRIKIINMENVFSAILRIAEVESQSRANFSLVNVNQLLLELLESYFPVAEDLNKIIVTNFKTEMFIQGDAKMLQQLFVNLLDNALRHTPEGASVQIIIENFESGKDRIIIADNGSGVSEQSLEHLFEPFFREDASRNTRGTGLGLSIVKAIADLHQIQIFAENTNSGFQVVLQV